MEDLAGSKKRLLLYFAGLQLINSVFSAYEVESCHFEKC